MDHRFSAHETAGSLQTRRCGLPVTEAVGVAHPDAGGITDELVRRVVIAFYARARHDGELGPVFASHVQSWDAHVERMTDFWSAALLRTGRYSGTPVEPHRAIAALNRQHFDRWVALFEATVRDLCAPPEAEAFVVRVRRMREGMIKSLRLDGA
jgi:hemoglobin